MSVSLGTNRWSGRPAQAVVGLLVAGLLSSLPSQPAAAVASDVGFFIKMTYHDQPYSIFQFGTYAGDMPVAGDWDGDGRDTMGIHRRTDGKFYLKWASNVDSSNAVYALGNQPGDLPVAGDWDDNDTDTIGIYRPSEGKFYLKLHDNTDANTTYSLGMAGDLPVVGDWNGDGKDTIGIYRRSTGKFYLNLTSNTGGYTVYDMGLPEDMPVAGDWNGDGKDTIGVHRPSEGRFILRPTVNSTGIEYVSLGTHQEDAPVAGNWDGNGSDTVGIHRANTEVFLNELEDMFGGRLGTMSVVEDGLASLNQAMQTADITTPARKAAFLATLLHESKIHYDAGESSGSGYYGRGFIQLTGSANYSAAGQYLGVDLLSNPELARTLQYSAPIARWYWTVARNINPLADQLDMGGVGRAIGYSYALDPEEENARCADFKIALAYYNYGYLPSPIDCTR